MRKWIKVLSIVAGIGLALGAAFAAWQKLGADAQEDLEGEIDGER